MVIEKKHTKTQKGGKRGRVYKRVHTHKRGRRFHKGGTPKSSISPQDDSNFDCNSVTWENQDDELKIPTSRTSYYSISSGLGILFGQHANNPTSPTSPTLVVTLFYKKIGKITLTPPSEKFYLQLIVLQSPATSRGFYASDLPVENGIISGKYRDESNLLSFSVILARQTLSQDDKNSVTFNITQLGTFTNKKLLKNLARINLPYSKETKDVYDFSFSNNDAIFKEIQSCIKQKLKEVYSNLLDLLKNCKLQQGNAEQNFETLVTSENQEKTDLVKKLLEKKIDIGHILNAMSLGKNVTSEVDKHKKNVETNIQRLIRLCNYIIFLLDKEELTETEFTQLDDYLRRFSLIYTLIKDNTSDAMNEGAKNNNYVEFTEPDNYTEPEPVDVVTSPPIFRTNGNDVDATIKTLPL